MPKITIVMSTYNRPALLARTIYSLRTQVEQDWELIAIDDHSPEVQTWQQLKGYALRDNRIKIFSNKVNEGAVCRLPYMLSSNSAYISILDDDDFWTPLYLSRLTKVLDDNKSKHIISCNIVKVLPSGQTKITDTLKGRPFPNVLPSCTIYRGDTYRKLGGLDAQFREYHSEAEYFYRCGGYRAFIHIKEPLVYMNFFPGSMSSDKTKCASYLEKLVEKHYGSLQYKKRELAEYYSRIGIHYAEANTSKPYYFIKAIKANPLMFEAWGALLLILINRKLLLRLYNLYKRMWGY